MGIYSVTAVKTGCFIRLNGVYKYAGLMIFTGKYLPRNLE